MARSCGIRIGPRRYELVVLEGNAKKHRVSAFATGEFPQGGEDPFADAVATLKAAAQQHRVPEDTLGIAIDSGLAAFRTLRTPDLEDDKLEEVIKFEVESQLPQWSIDDVIVDFFKLEEKAGEAKLLVTAVQKSDLKRELDLCAKAGLEPLDAEIEASAMVNAALAADVCHEDDAQVLVHIGETSTAVVVIDGRRVRSMRAIHIGSLSHEPGLAAAAAAAAAATAAEAPELAEGEEPLPPPVAPDDPEERQRRLEQAVSRIRRELGRTLSGARTTNTIDAVYVCGWELPGLVGTTLLDVPVYELDVFEQDSGQPAQGAAPLVVAYGVALRHMGTDALHASLRREELRYTGAFERVELPLAVASLLLVTTLAVFNIFELKFLSVRDGDVNLWRRSANNFMLGNPRGGVAGNLEVVPDPVQKYIDGVRRQNDGPGVTVDNNPEVDPDRTRLEQLENVERLLKIEIARLNNELGNTGEITQPQSALEGLTRVIQTLDELGERVGRVSVRKAHSQYQVGNASRPDAVEVTLDLTFFADDSLAATRNYEAFQNALRQEPFVLEVQDRGTKPLEEGSGVSTEGLRIRMDLSRVPTEVQQ